jgi:hypothetical protein
MDEQHLIERYEAKYLLSPAQVPLIRQAICHYCKPDKASANGPYFISSLYLDSPRFLLYHNTKANLVRRFKLRVRRYENDQLFLEIKDKHKDVILKSRSVIPYTHWPDLLLDPTVIDSIELDSQTKVDFYRFLNLMQLTQAQPAVVVRYLREAWYSPIDEYARITFDHHIEGAAPNGWQIPIHSHEKADWIPADLPHRFHLPHSGVVLELKCTRLIPPWMNDLVSQFQLKRRGFSKYSYCLEAIYPNLLNRKSWLVGKSGFDWRNK